MLREYEKVLTKAAQHQKQQYLDKSISSIKVKSQKEITIPSYTRQAAIFIRNWIRNIMRRNFKKMLSRHMMKRACWRLVTSKKKRDMEWAFLMIREYNSQNKLKKIQNFYNRQPELRIMNCICKRIISKPQRQVFDRIKTYTLRKKQLFNFASILVHRCQERAFREGSRQFWSIFIGRESQRRQKQTATNQIVGWLKWRRSHLMRGTFYHLIELVRGTSCFKDIDEWQEKKQKVKNNQVNRKQTLIKLKQQIKQIKPLLEKEKQARYKVYNEHKKKMSSNKVELLDITRKHEKERKEEQDEVDWVQQQLDEWERMLASRRSIVKKHQNATNICLKTYKLIGGMPQQFRGIQNVLPKAEQDIANFRQSENYYFLSNLVMGKLVEIYQKRDPYNYQAQYYELEYENKVVRQTIRCFVRGQYESYINHRRRDQRKKSMAILHENGE